MSEEHDVLITGASGLIGSALVEYVAEKKQINRSIFHVQYNIGEGLILREV